MTKRLSLLKAPITLFILSSLFTSCAKISVSTPSSRFISPETNGDFMNGTAKLNGSNSAEATFTLENTNNIEELSLEGNRIQLGTDLHLGLHEKIDFFMKSNADTPTIFGFKYQLLGKSRLNASKGDKSFAITFGGGQGTENDVNDDIFSTSKKTKTDIEQQIIDFSAIYGQRISDKALLYASVSATRQKASGKFESDNVNFDNKKFDLTGWSYVAALGGVRYMNNYVLNLEANLQRLSWEGAESVTYGNISGSIGLTWD